ncbi:hypothetical protein GCM10025864_21150 [Luteimicrobium album]|uniref:Uncharacterized protein n=1 Tax=Luteimicrobium album TaxID=1054550 RepID=A0ABQ6HZN7_9MICO|nr:hypothetical protein GCM10025864_12060 [Luteimicrobium album]GMA24284.1 hypothetical protein GCM10025864_20430 [Luteimicrobium album]GMA24356.1 hypothetical protein GCM10025864_21150 [Luteimicrobium album]
MVVLVTAQRFAGDPVDPGQPVDPAPHQHRVDRGGRHAKASSDLDRAQAVTPPQPHDLLDHVLRGAGRAATRTRAAVAHPAAPSARYRSAHFFAVRAETMNIFAAAE